MRTTTKERERRRKRAVRAARKTDPGGSRYVATIKGDGSAIVERFNGDGSARLWRHRES